MIPARLDSKRFPQKIFAKLGEKTLLGNVIEAAKKVSLFDGVYVACCSEQVVDEAKKHGVKGILTDPSLENGTLRIIDAIQKQGILGDLFVNWQGDEPFINEQMIMELISGTGSIRTLKKKIDEEEAKNPSVVKVVTDNKGKALYFSRSPIPFIRGEKTPYFKHVGLYAFEYSALNKLKNLEPCILEKAEVLEQLRWLENGLSIEVMETLYDTKGIDTEKDLFEVNQYFKLKV
jgi:3-deoxy-manno-octulosonate cytidylyltransferase (CMP-KDO synthetase)